MKRIRRILGLSVVLSLVTAVGGFAAGQTEEGTTVIDIPRQPRVYIAPENPDAEHTELQLNPEVAPAPDRIILAYELVVYDTDGNEVWSDSEEITESRGFFGNLFNIGDVPQIDPEVIRDLTWDGVDNDGDPVENGEYIYQLFVTDDRDDTYRTPPQNLTVDNEPPEIRSLEPDYLTFSPGVEGLREELPITQDATAEVRWTGRFLNEDGDVVREYTWENPVQYDPAETDRQVPSDDRIPEDFSWDGRDDDGEIVPDGTYTYELEGHDRPGNVTSETITDIRVATEEGDVGVSPDVRAISPEGPTPEVELGLEYDEVLDVTEWTVMVVESGNESTVYRSFSDDGTPPESVTWDGTDDNGDVVSDGDYEVIFSLVYENGVESESLPASVVVDTTPPEAQLSTSPEVFGGETQPTLTVDGEWERDASWEAVVNVEDETYEFNLDSLINQYNISPDMLPVEWSGVDLDGDRLPDGTYSGYLRGTDEAGNVGESNEVSFAIDRRDTPIDVEISNDVVLPEFGGLNDEIEITPVLEVTDRVESMQLSIREVDGDEAVRTFESDGAVDSFTWLGEDDFGRVLEAGEYEAELQVFYENGNQPTTVSDAMEVDRDPPTLEVSVSTDISAISPDGPTPEVDLMLEYDDLIDVAEWHVRIVDTESSSTVYRSITGQGTPPDTVTWDGRDNAGEIIPDDEYHVVFTAIYENDIEAVSDPASIVVDTTAPEAELSTSPDVFGGETRPTLSIDGDWDQEASWEAHVTVNGTDYEFELDELIGQYDITPDMLPVEWDGVDFDGDPLPDGTYSGFLRGTDEAGNVGESNEAAFVIDRRDTPVDIELSDNIVSPDFEGVNDEIMIRPVPEVTDRIESVSVVIREIDGDVVRTFESDELVESFAWDGTDDSDRIVDAGEYEAELQVFYENGNQPTALSDAIEVDRQAPGMALNVPYTEFAPNGDGYRDTLPVSIDPEEPEAIESWRGVVENEDGEVVRSVARDGAPPAQVEWDGRNDNAEVVDGYYSVGIEIDYEGEGRTEHFVDEEILLDASGPELEVSAEPLPYTPMFNGDEQDLEGTISAEDNFSDIVDWQLELLDPEGNVVASSEGEGTPPEEVTWDGILADGEMVLSAVEYVARLTVTDELQNESVEELEILTDIIVREENGRLVIVVPSINFEPYESYLFADINDQLQENLSTLRRLARVLNEFEDRDIIVEGHANHVWFENEAEMQREQQEYLLPLSRDRAIEVRDALAILGVDLDRMTVEAIGGDRPRVEFDNYEQTWQNRRVEFLLDRNDD